MCSFVVREGVHVGGLALRRWDQIDDDDGVHAHTTYGHMKM